MFFDQRKKNNKISDFVMIRADSEKTSVFILTKELSKQNL